MKAAFLYNLITFTEWRHEAFSFPQTPIVIGILGLDPFGDELDSLVAGRTIRGRPLAIRRFAATEGIACGLLLFVSKTKKKHLPSLWRQIQDCFTLTVSDMSGFLDDGGAIALVREVITIRFAVNIAASQKSQLQVSSKLLSLAVVVKVTRTGDTP